MSRIRGRPKKAVRQEKNVGFFLTYAQYAVVVQKAAAAGVNISDYMRQVALTAEVRAKWTEEERKMVRGLIRMSADLNRLASLQGTESAAFFVSLRDQLDVIIKNLSHDR
jgi:hypothetical protein